VSNLAIRADLAVSAKFMTLPGAKDWGAIALFGETYDEQVRVVEVGGPWSRELCGGTHVSRTSQIGLVSVRGESSVGAGVRRIEAEVGIEALRNLFAERALIRNMSATLRVPATELESKVNETLGELRSLEKKLDEYRLSHAKAELAGLYPSTRDVAGKKVLAVQLSAVTNAETLRQLTLVARDQLGPSGVVLLGAGIDGKPVVMIAVGQDAVLAGVKAGDIARTAADVLGGGGGGRPEFAQAGGTDFAKLAQALEVAQGIIS
jgi:alanyl-tRNA synthetase